MLGMLQTLQARCHVCSDVGSHGDGVHYTVTVCLHQVTLLSAVGRAVYRDGEFAYLLKLQWLPWEQLHSFTVIRKTQGQGICILHNQCLVKFDQLGS